MFGLYLCKCDFMPYFTLMANGKYLQSQEKKVSPNKLRERREEQRGEERKREREDEKWTERKREREE